MLWNSALPLLPPDHMVKWEVAAIFIALAVGWHEDVRMWKFWNANCLGVLLSMEAPLEVTGHAHAEGWQDCPFSMPPWALPEAILGQEL